VIPPSPATIRTARKAARLTQKQAAELVSVSLSTWGKWEAGTHRMPASTFEMFLIKTQQLKQSKCGVEK
jgi:transcriptional regulator with XRE-family HTH domain